MNDHIGAEVCKYRGFEAIAPGQVAGSDSNGAIKQDGPHDQLVSV